MSSNSQDKIERIANSKSRLPCNKATLRLCAETIYRFIYAKEHGALGLYEHPPKKRKKRRRRGSRKIRNSRIPPEYDIHQRPEYIDNCEQFGNWEGDLMIFERDLGEANVTTLVERKSRYCVMTAGTRVP